MRPWANSCPLGINHLVRGGDRDRSQVKQSVSGEINGKNKEGQKRRECPSAEWARDVQVLFLWRGMGSGWDWLG